MLYKAPAALFETSLFASCLLMEAFHTMFFFFFSTLDTFHTLQQSFVQDDPVVCTSPIPTFTYYVRGQILVPAVKEQFIHVSYFLTKEKKIIYTVCIPATCKVDILSQKPLLVCNTL